jgi:hypothetical protein
MDITKIALEVLKDLISGKNIINGENYRNGMVQVNSNYMYIQFYTIYGQLFSVSFDANKPVLISE